jgi:simple sugar transport system ATP-binding protein
LRGITKRFGAVVACDDVDLELHRGRIHGILGENGAGKSTLMKVLIGLVIPDAGELSVDGRTVTIPDPLAAAALGIGMVHQHFSLVEPLSVWENVTLGDAGRLDPRAVRARVAEISERYGLDVDPDAKVADLSTGMRQRVEIIKCLRRDPQVLVFDEPTSVLSPADSEYLFAALRQVVDDEGRAVALVSHKLDEILRVTDEVTIMRQGRVVGRQRTSEADVAGLAQAMVGRPVSLRTERAALGLAIEAPAPTEAPIAPTSAAAVLEVRDATVRVPHGAVLLDRLSLAVGRGEIVGVAGVEGNGQRPLGDVLSSLVRLDGGEIVVDGTSVPTGVAGAMARAGIAVVPEDRHDSGCVLEMSVAENLFLADPQRVTRRGLLDRALLRARARALIEEFEISCTGPDAPFWSLSGGNQQRVVLARELSHDPKVLVAAQPTRGLDVGAIEYMSDRLRRARASGVAVLLISSELEEVLDLADRVVVISKGRIVGEMVRGDVDIDRLGLLMGGVVAEADLAGATP